ncbi:MAG TPA: SpoIIE family protein phosphatase [Terriglobia bacterium]|nr:SpoIIE family protein phosphatase [Terriglobia bacterium]
MMGRYQSKTISGPPVGLIPGTDYRQTVVSLKPGDLLVLYTDGITEAENEAGQDLGRDRLLEWARQAPNGLTEGNGRSLAPAIAFVSGRRAQ